MYLALFAMLRFILRRETGSLGITDLLVIVLIADAAQNGMAGDYTSITDGLLLVVTIIGWSYLLNLLAFRYPLCQRIVQAPRVQLVRDGRMIRRNLEHEKITEDELLAEIGSSPQSTFMPLQIDELHPSVAAAHRREGEIARLAIRLPKTYRDARR